jgi:hypothetical protein
MPKAAWHSFSIFPNFSFFLSFLPPANSTHYFFSLCLNIFCTSVSALQSYQLV